MSGCEVSLNGKGCGGIAAAVAKKLAPASGHIVLPVLAMRAAWTGGRPEDRGASMSRGPTPPRDKQARKSTREQEQRRRFRNVANRVGKTSRSQACLNA